MKLRTTMLAFPSQQKLFVGNFHPLRLPPILLALKANKAVHGPERNTASKVKKFKLSIKAKGVSRLQLDFIFAQTFFRLLYPSWRRVSRASCLSLSWAPLRWEWEQILSVVHQFVRQRASSGPRKDFDWNNVATKSHQISLVKEKKTSSKTSFLGSWAPVAATGMGWQHLN